MSIEKSFDIKHMYIFHSLYKIILRATNVCVNKELSTLLSSQCYIKLVSGHI